MATKVNVRDRVQKGQGASIYFEEEVLPGTVPSPEPGTEPQPDTPTGTQPSPGTPTIPSPDTGTVTSPLIKPSEILFRMIGYYTEGQRKFIKNKAKKYKVTEAEIMRIAVEELMKSGKL